MKKNIHIILSMILLLVTIAIFGPVELYCTNYDEFWFSPKDMMIVSVILFVVIGVLGGIIGLLLKGKAREIYSCILFSVGIASYLQGNYININYGVLNGKDINWGQYWGYAILDTLIWLLIIGVSVFLYTHKADIFRKIQTYASIWIIAIEFVTLGVLLMTTDVLKNEKSTYYLSDEGIYEVSEKDNIIIFVLDTFDDAYYQEIYNEDPEKYQDVFSDFTYFRNALAGGAPTKYGMPAIITGEHYPGTISYSEYIQQSFDKDGIYTTLQKKNYDVGIYSESIFVPDGADTLVNNQMSSGYAVSNYPRLSMKYLSLTLYKYMPHILKKYFWIYTGEFDQFMQGNSANEYIFNDEEFCKELLKSGLEVNKEKNVFRIIHLMGPHPPYTLDEYASPSEAGQTSAVIQGKGALYIVENYIERMKSLGVYDSSTIVVMADHGAWNTMEHGMLLVKLKNDSKKYAESDAPVSYYDLHATLFKELGIDNGLSFFEIPLEKRTRYFYAHTGDGKKMSVTEYVAEGNSSVDFTIQPTGTILSQTIKDEKYEYGTQLTFGDKNTASPFILSGISMSDPDSYSWTNGTECKFSFEFGKKPKKNLQVTLDVMRIYNDKQRVICYANDKICYRDVLSEGKQIRFIIPKDQLQDEVLTLRFELPDAVSPSEIAGGEYADVRVLALAITGFRIDETDEEATIPVYSESDHYSFGVDGNADEYLMTGWYEPENGHNWATNHAEFAIKTDRICDYDLNVYYGNYELSGDTDVYLNDVLIGTAKVSDSKLNILVPKELLNEDGNQVLLFNTPNAVSPNDAEGAADKRVLGICLYSIDVIPIDEE